MTNQAKHDESHNELEEDAGLSKTDNIRILLKKAAHYAMLGLAPLIAIIALIVAVMAFSASRSSQAQLTDALSKLDAVNKALKAAKTELAAVKSLKAEIIQHKAQQEESRKNQEALDEKIVQGVSRMQTKLRISPTLEEQLKLNASAPASALPAPSAKATSAAPAAPNQASPQVQAIKEAIKKFNQKR